MFLRSVFKKLRFLGDLRRDGNPESHFLQCPPPSKFLCSFTTGKNPDFCLKEFLRESCGIPPERVPAVSKALGGRTLRRPYSLLVFLRNEGFSKTQIADLVSKFPKLLHSRVETTLKPKFEFLREKGLSQSEIADSLSSHPWILHSNVDNHLRPLYDILLPLVGSNMTAGEIIWWLSVRKLSCKKTVVPNVILLRDHGVPDLQISKVLRRRSRVMWCSTTRFSELVKRVVELGFSPSSPLFIKAAQALSQMSSSTLEAKLKVFKSFGWSNEDVFFAFRRSPHCLSISTDLLRKKLDLFRKLGWGESVLTLNPVLLGLSLEKRLVPRLVILEALESKKLIKDIKALYQFKMSDAEFQKKYVIKYQDKFAGILELYQSSFGLKEDQLSKSKRQNRLL